MNITDYTKNMLLTFDHEALNEIDGLIFTALSYISWPKEIIEAAGNKGIALKELYRAELFHDMFDGTVMEENTILLFQAAAASPRFRDCILHDYVTYFDASEEKQFSAITFQYLPDSYFISFRGTDSTLIGWKEDFNMSFTYPVPAQLDAAAYTKDIADKTSGSLVLGGHSKGGNLAVYAAANTPEIFDRLKAVYSFDGPGFMEEIQHSAPFQKIESLVCKIVPQSSVIGMLMEENTDYRIVKSDGIGIWQHDAFTWLIDDNQFTNIDKMTTGAVAFDRTLNNWLKTISKEERSRFIDTLYSLTENIDAVSISDLNENGLQNYRKIFSNLRNMDDDNWQFVVRIIGDMASYPFANIPDLFKVITQNITGKNES